MESIETLATITAPLAGALVTSGVLTWLALRWALTSERARRAFASIQRAYTPQTHTIKSGTPTFGGIVIVPVALGSSFLWTLFLSPPTVSLLPLFLWWGFVLSMAALGLADDRYKYRVRGGLSIRLKLLIQFPLTLAFLWGSQMLLSPPFAPSASETITPWTLSLVVMIWPLGATLFLLLGSFWAVFLTNAVNLTDGLDGLAATNGIVVLLAIVAWVLLGISGVLGVLTLAPPSPDVSFSLPLYLWHNRAVAIGVTSLIGGFMGFLWFNLHPAKIFMGDTGSLALGAGITAAGVLFAMEIPLTLIAVVFVMEGLSVVIQVAAVRGWGRRVFRISPIHHHFEMGGWSETQTVGRFMLLTIGATCLVLWMVIR